jgi:hypothetical protein
LGVRVNAGEVFGGEADCHAAFTDGGSGHSCAAGADIADGEDAGLAGLE